MDSIDRIRESRAAEDVQWNTSAEWLFGQTGGSSPPEYDNVTYTVDSDGTIRTDGSF